MRQQNQFVDLNAESLKANSKAKIFIRYLSCRTKGIHLSRTALGEYTEAQADQYTIYKQGKGLHKFVEAFSLFISY